MDLFVRGLAVGSAVLLAALAKATPPLDEAEVRLPYGELRALIEASQVVPNEEKVLPPALASCRLGLSLDGAVPVIDAEFRTVRFGDGLSLVPLIGGEVALISQEPDSERLVLGDAMICQAGESAGTSRLRARFLATGDGREFELQLPTCASSQLVAMGMPEGAALAITADGAERIVAGGEVVALPTAGGAVRVRRLDEAESSAALKPPEPSSWSWQHQSLVVPAGGELCYHLLAHGSAAEGSGVEATLRLPADARGVTVDGDDLDSSRSLRGSDGSPRLLLRWATRDVLERDVEIRYRLPLRPLDETWSLQVPEGEGPTKTRFVIPARPELSFVAPGLVGPLAGDGLPGVFSTVLRGSPHFVLEDGASAELAVRRLPVVATDDALVSTASWSLELEADGAMLAEGSLTVLHTSARRLQVDTPAGMKLLACQIGGAAVDPIDLGEGRLDIPLPASGGNKGGASSTVSLSFTGKTAGLDPLEGVLALSLPRTPVFIRTLAWKIQLPSGYRAEVEGNLERVFAKTGGKSPGIQLSKKLCRDERPEVRVFYQSRHVNP